MAKGQNGKDYLYVQENSHAKAIDLEKSIQERKCVLHEVLVEEYHPIFHRIYHLPEGKTFIGKRISYQDPKDQVREKPSYTLYQDKKELKKWDIFPDLVHVDQPEVLTMEYVDRLYFKSDGTKAISVMDMVDVITIFDLDSFHTIGIRNPSSYSFSDMNDHFRSENLMDQLIIYNMYACVAEDCFFVLKDGRYYKDMLGSSSDESNFSHVNVYDWNGHLLHKVSLDKALWSISYSKSSHTLYGLGINRDIVYKYKMK